MDIKEHTTPSKLECYALEWSLLRLVIGGISLIWGATPVLARIMDSSSAWSLLQIFWIISGLVALYLGYMWYKGGMKVFGKSDTKTKALFLVMIVTGLNLGWTGLAGNNIGMNLAYGFSFANILYLLTGLLYLYTAYFLWDGWNANEKQLFTVGRVPAVETPAPSESAPTETPVSEPEQAEEMLTTEKKDEE